MDTREQIERALKAYFPRSIAWSPEQTGKVYDALADQAIVIECEVEHKTLTRGPGEVAPKTILFASSAEPPYWGLSAAGSGHHGTSGKAIAIIVPLEEE